MDTMCCLQPEEIVKLAEIKGRDGRYAREGAMDGSGMPLGHGALLRLATVHVLIIRAASGLGSHAGSHGLRAEPGRTGWQR